MDLQLYSHVAASEVVGSRPSVEILGAHTEVLSACIVGIDSLLSTSRSCIPSSVLDLMNLFEKYVMGSEMMVEIKYIIIKCLEY